MDKVIGSSTAAPAFRGLGRMNFMQPVGSKVGTMGNFVLNQMIPQGDQDLEGKVLNMQPVLRVEIQDILGPTSMKAREFLRRDPQEMSMQYRNSSL